MPGENNTQNPTLEKMVFKLWKSQQRQRRWRLIKRLFWFMVLSTAGMYTWTQIRPMMASRNIGTLNQPHIAVIDLKGIIRTSFDLRDVDTADTFIPRLQRTLANPNVTAVVLRIDSGGGEVVTTQSIHREIQYQREQHPTIPIIAVCENICASGAYYIASACNEIYAHPASLIGSIGVRGAGVSLGLADLLKKLGAERRIITAGKYSNFLDPFLPSSTEELQMQQSMINEVHTVFINAVKAGRGHRLKALKQGESEEVLFSGQIWTGRQALPLGLIDGLHTIRSLTRDVLKTKNVVYYDFVIKPNLMDILRKLLPAFLGQ